VTKAEIPSEFSAMDVLFGLLRVVLDALAPTPLARTFWIIFLAAALILAGLALLRSLAPA
jgi:hypothetical protein